MHPGPPKPEPREAPLTENAIPLPAWALGPHHPSATREPIDPAKGFWGTVLLIDVALAPHGGVVGAYYGFIKIVSADVTGMKPARGDTPWVAQVSGREDDVYVPGCKVAAVHRGVSRSDEELPESAKWKTEEGTVIATYTVP